MHDAHRMGRGGEEGPDCVVDEKVRRPLGAEESARRRAQGGKKASRASRLIGIGRHGMHTVTNGEFAQWQISLAPQCCFVPAKATQWLELPQEHTCSPDTCWN
jgi:hypothetical protein